MSDERLTDALRERLLIGAQKLGELERKLIAAQAELAEAAMFFQISGSKRGTRARGASNSRKCSVCVSRQPRQLCRDELRRGIHLQNRRRELRGAIHSLDCG